MEKITIGGSSFVNPGSRHWRALQEIAKVQFLEYGNNSQIVAQHTLDDALIWLEVFDDAFADNTEDVDEDLGRKHLNYLLGLIEQRCENSSETFLFLFSCSTQAQSIRYTRSLSLHSKLKFWMMPELEKLALKYSKFHFWDMDHILADIGYQKAFDTRNWYFAHCRFSDQGLKLISNAIMQCTIRKTKAAHKVLVLDCDNTLWGGVVGEDGTAGIAIGGDGIGRAFCDFQKSIKRLKKEGVILVIASKNNHQDAQAVFDNRSEMILGWGDIAASRINWDDKSKNILEMSEELGLGVDSFVFWDDSPIERGKTKTLLPEMYTVDVPESVWEWPKILDNLFALTKFETTSEDEAKTAQYKARADFVRAKKTNIDEKSFLRSIEMRPDLEVLSEDNIGRAVQLCQKTNQFNLTTRRHSEKDLTALSAHNAQYCCVTNLSDCFSNHGRVGVFCLQELSSTHLLIDTFLLSCRVLGREYEFWVMQKIISIARDNGMKTLVAQYRGNEKNKVAINFLAQCGFEAASPDEISLLEQNCGILDGATVFRRSVDVELSRGKDIYAG